MGWIRPILQDLDKRPCSRPVDLVSPVDERRWRRYGLRMELVVNVEGIDSSCGHLRREVLPDHPGPLWRQWLSAQILTTRLTLVEFQAYCLSCGPRPRALGAQDTIRTFRAGL